MTRRADRETFNGISVVVSDLENTCPRRACPVSLHPENELITISGRI
jgi:hypothetical protein